MNMPEGTRLAYTLTHESYYAASLTRQGREIHVEARDLDGQGSLWGFDITEDDIGVHLGIWDDAWGAFTAVPEFFARIARMAAEENLTLDMVQLALDALGAIDVTKRTDPDLPAKPSNPIEFLHWVAELSTGTRSRAQLAEAIHLAKRLAERAASASMRAGGIRMDRRQADEQ